MTKIEPAREWSVGHQPAEGAAHEEPVGTNWFDAAQRLHDLFAGWAAEQDRAAQPGEYSVANTMATMWNGAPPSYTYDASYEITDHDGASHRFYLAGRDSK